MSNIKAFIDYSMEDNGSSAREALYADIHDRVMGAIEAKKMELAGGMLARESFDRKSKTQSILEDAEKTVFKIEKLKEEIAALEEALSLVLENESCSEDDADEIESEIKSKKKKLKKKEKKMDKLKEEYTLLEGEEDEIDENVEWSGEESVEQIDEISKRLVGNALRKANHNSEMDYDDGGDGSKWDRQAAHFKSHLQKKSPKNEVPGRGTRSNDPIKGTYPRSGHEEPTKSGKIHKSTQKGWAKDDARTLRRLQNQPKPNLPE